MSIMQMLLATSAGGINADDYFQSTLWTGNASARDITTGLDMTSGTNVVWIKNRDNTRDHLLYDTERGANKEMSPNKTDGSQTNNTRLTSFNSNGFSIGDNALVNESNDKIVGWSFKGDPEFLDIQEYSGNGTNERTISHNLSVAPGMVIIKNKGGGGYEWGIYNRGVGSGKAGKWPVSNQQWSTSQLVLTEDPTSSSMKIAGNVLVNQNNEQYIAYIFANKEGLIKCDKYTGSGNSQTIDCGFEAQWVMIRAVTRSEGWYVFDANFGSGKYLRADTFAVEATNSDFSFASSGFSVSGSAGFLNMENVDYAYVAIAAGS